MTINPSGSVGINTASPAAKLDVSGTFRTNGIGANVNPISAGTNQNYFRFLSSGSDFYVGTESSVAGAFFTGSLAYDNVLYGNSTAINFINNGVSRIYIASGGNIGMGYTAPAAKLAVSGTTLINTNTDNGVDKLQVSGSAIITTGLQAATTSGNVSLRNTATTYPVNITTGTTSGIGMYEDAGSAVIIGTNAAVTAMSPISIRGTLVDLDGNLKVNAAGRVLIGNPTPNDITGEALQVSGAIICDQFKIWGLNTAPATASSTGTLGEIRIDANYIYICTATNTWKRVAIATW
jgi:hypothetical protein